MKKQIFLLLTLIFCFVTMMIPVSAQSEIPLNWYCVRNKDHKQLRLHPSLWERRISTGMVLSDAPLHDGHRLEKMVPCGALFRQRFLHIWGWENSGNRKGNRISGLKRDLCEIRRSLFSDLLLILWYAPQAHRTRLPLVRGGFQLVLSSWCNTYEPVYHIPLYYKNSLLRCSVTWYKIAWHSHYNMLH